jgi:predicted short-subunit dehydrogenase-like oxidoreductase (DUF2520 family)
VLGGLKNEHMNIVILGSGNTATAIGHLCHRANYNILQVFGRNRLTTDILSKALNAEGISEWEDIVPDAALYIVALPDSFLPYLHKHFSLQKGLVVHTAGSVSMQVLNSVSRNYGVLYPLQSLHKNTISYSNIPLLVDGNTAEDKTLLADFAATLSGKVGYANDSDREKLHLSAVWVNNFTNHLFTMGWNICRENNLDFNLLLPLMEQTVSRLHFGNPPDFQTGPAIRGDISTIQKHLNMMNEHPDMQVLYKTLSSSIEGYFKIPTL